MARDFQQSNSDHLTATSAIVSDTPLSLSIWFNPDDITSFYGLFSISDDSASNYLTCYSAGSVGGDPFYVEHKGGGGSNATALSSDSIVASTWQQGAYVATSNADRSSFLNGAGKVF